MTKRKRVTHPFPTCSADSLLASSLLSGYSSLMAEPKYANLIADILWPSGDQSHLWSGSGDIFFLGRQYIGAGHFTAIDNIEDSIGLKDGRLRISIQIQPPELRTMFLNSPGRVEITLTLIISEDQQSWSVAPRKFTGIVTNPRLTSTSYDFDLVEEMSHIRFAETRRWTPESHESRHPGDKIFQYAEVINSGAVQLNWPA